MSEGDVSQIRDEDVLRRLWQQTEDFSRKKEIRAHMYRLREERLRSLYSPEPTIDGKGCEFASTQGHLMSFADQSFQSMKSKEVRDAASPPKDFVYRGQDLKELSNAGWNVESENRTADDGHTHVRSVQANIEGNYDVDGGRGKFGAIDQHKTSLTEYKDDNSSLKKKETASHTAAHEQVMQHTDDGTKFSSTTSSSKSTSKFQQVSSTKHESVPYVTSNDYDISQQTCDKNDNLEKTTRYTKTSDFDQSIRKSDYEQAELISRKVEYPDDNTKVVVETRCLPDGTRVTSTRREFRAPVIQTSQSEHHSTETRKENKTLTSSTEKHSDVKHLITTTSNEAFDRRNQYATGSSRLDENDLNKNHRIDLQTYDNYPHKMEDHKDVKRSQHFEQKTYDIVDSQRLVDVNDFKNDPHNDNASDITSDTYTITEENITNAQVDKTLLRKNVFSSNIERNTFNKSELNTNDQQQNIISSLEKKTAHSIQDNKTSNDVNLSTKIDNNTEKSIDQVKITRLTTENNGTEKIIEKKSTSDQYQTNYIQRKISTDWSPSHQAWASTLRADTPPKENTPTRASSPGSRTMRSSTSSLRSSVSPEKLSKKPGSRGTSPTKTVRTSPSRNINRFTSPEKNITHDTSPTRATKTPNKMRPNASPDKHPEKYIPGTIRLSQSPEKQTIDFKDDRPVAIPDRKKGEHISRLSPDKKPPSGKSVSPPRSKYSPDKQPKETSPVICNSPEKTGHKLRTVSQHPSSPRTSPTRSITTSPDRHTIKMSMLSKTEEDHNQFVDEETKFNEKTPEYMRPTASQTPSSPRTSPTRCVTRSPDRHTIKTSTLSKTEQDHYRFVDEETKMHKNTPGYLRLPASQTSSSPRTSPTRSDTGFSDRRTVKTTKETTEENHNRYVDEETNIHKETPGYMRPTASQTSSSPRTSPTRCDTRSPDRHTIQTSTLSNTEQDQYRFVDEETKIHKKTPGYMRLPASQTSSSPRTSPTRSDTGLSDKHTVKTTKASMTEENHNRYVDDETNIHKETPEDMRPTASQTPSSPRTSPTRCDTRSPDRNTIKTSTLSKTKEYHHQFVDKKTKIIEKTPGYMRPTTSQTPSAPSTSPTRSDTRSPDRHTITTSTLSKTEKDHNQFVDEETKFNEKTPEDVRPTASQTPSSPRTSPTRCDTRSPDRHTIKTSTLSKTQQDHYRFVDEETKIHKKTPGYMRLPASQTSSSPRTSPTRSDIGLSDRRTVKTTKASTTEENHNRYVDEETNIHKETPGYMRPTSSQTPSKPRTSPTRSDTRSPDRYTIQTSKLSKSEQDHNQFVDEQKEIYKQNEDYTSKKDSYQKRSDRPKNSPSKDTPDFSKPETLRREKSPSPPKGSVTFNSQQEFNVVCSGNLQTHKKDFVDTNIKKVTKDYENPKYDDSLDNFGTDRLSRDTSPSKYGINDRKERKSEAVTKEISTLIEDFNDVKRDISIHRHKSPTKCSHPSDLPAKRSSKETFPTKSSTQHIYTTDFINNERKAEEIVKKTTRPRQLITPSTSPTRKVSTTEKDPSTGQSSPTTSVSGFVYFSSPRPDNRISNHQTDQNPDCYSESKTNESIRTDHNIEKEMISKLPCKSSKQTSPTKESLPRKSSLKKPSESTVPLNSPNEKPPTNFRVSPTEPENHVVKKDKPDKSELASEFKSKPPLERRETYEERCRKILGMMEDEKTLNRNTNNVDKYPDAQKHSPSILPCSSPDVNELLPSSVSPSKLIHNKESIRQKEETIQQQEKQKILSRDTSPTKLQDILSIPKHDAKVRNVTIEAINTSEDASKEESNKKSATTPVRKLREPSPIKLSEVTGNENLNYEENAPSSTKTSTLDVQKKLQETNYKDKVTSQTHTLSSKSVLTTERQNNFKDTTHTKTDVSEDREKSTTTCTPSLIKSSSKEVNAKPEVPGHSRTPSPTKSAPTIGNVSSEEHQYLKKRNQKQPFDKQNDVKPSKQSEQTLPHRTLSSTKAIDKITEIATREEQYSTKEITMQSKDKYSNINKISDKQVPVRSPSENSHEPSATSHTKSSKSPSKIDKVKELKSRSPSPSKNISKSLHQQQSNSIDSRYPVKPNDVKISPSKIDKVKEPKSRSPSPVKNISRSLHQQQSNSPHSRYPVKPNDVKTIDRKPINESKITKYNTEFIEVEKEREALNKMQTHSRENSPDRSESFSIDEDSSDVLDDTERAQYQSSYSNTTTIGEDTKTKVLVDEKPRDRLSSKLPSRNVSPTKKTAIIINKTDKCPESPTKPRSSSPKKLTSPTETSQSTQILKPGTPKQKDSTLSRKTISQSKIENRKTSDQQSSISKISTNKLSNTQSPHKPSPKGYVKKETEIKFARITGDISKRQIPLKTRSKPDIQVSDVMTKFPKRTTKINKMSLKETQTKLANKPKSATALNTSIEEDDIIVDVQLAKSSRENSPDRICPTPINVQDDVSTPRFPDEVSEPDDEFRRRAHHIIHETETIVDDIVEISEDDELFVKRRTDDEIMPDESFLSVTDNVTKFTNKINTISKPTDNIANKQSAETEKIVHSDFIADDLKSDECLLSVSEKVTKFAKGPNNKRDAKSPSRKIIDEFDNDTVYQDDYTKLSVNDKTHLFIETAEKAKATKVKSTQKAERPDFSDVDETLRTDDCLLSVSDKVNKFVKSAEHFLTDSQDTTEKDKKIKEKHEMIMKSITQDSDNEFHEAENNYYIPTESSGEKIELISPLKSNHSSTKHKTFEKTTPVKITTLRSSEAVKKAKALFENIGSTTQKTKDNSHKTTTKLTDIGVLKKSPKTDSTIVHHPSVEDTVTEITDNDNEVDFSQSSIFKNYPSRKSITPHPLETLTPTEKRQSSPDRSTSQTPEVPRSVTPSQYIKTPSATATKTVLSRYPYAQHPGTPKQSQPPTEKSTKPQNNVPGYLKPTKTSQIREEIQHEGSEVTSHRSSGKFGIELRRTSTDRTSVSSERRHSVEHHQPCIEDTFDVDLLEHMLEKVVGYEQRRRIRTQIRIAKKKCECEQREASPTAKTIKHNIVSTPKNRSPERQPKATPQKTLSPERHAKSKLQNTKSPERHLPKGESKPITNGHAKDKSTDKLPRPQSPEKRSKLISKTKNPIRQPSPEKNSTSTPKTKTNRFDEYAFAYMKKVGLKESDNLKFANDKIQTSTFADDNKTKMKIKEYKTSNTESLVISRTRSNRSSSKDIIEVVQRISNRSPDKRTSPEQRTESLTEKTRSPSPDHKQPRDHKNQTMLKTAHEKMRSPSPDHKRPRDHKNETMLRTAHEKMRSPSPDHKQPRDHKNETMLRTSHEKMRSPSPDHKRPRDHKNETMLRSAHDLGKQSKTKQVQEEKPSWVTNRNLKKITPETRTVSSKKIENEKPKYKASSPSKVISKPIDVITSSYGPGPLDADGRPLFGIKALKKGAANFQVKGTVIRQEYHSTNGGEPEGTVSVTAYSSQPEELERLLAVQGERPSRLHGLAAITTTKKFGGTTGSTLSEAHTREDSATLQQFTQSDRRVTGSRVEEVTECGRDSPQRLEVSDDTRAKQSTDKSRVRTETGPKRVVQSKVEDVTKMEKRIDKREQNVRQSSVKSLTEKFIKHATEPARSERSAYPKAGLILRSTGMRDSVSSDSSTHAGLTRTDSEHSLASDGEETTVVTTTQDADGRRVTTKTTTRHQTHTQGTQERSFLDSTTKVTGVQDILTRMKNADIVIEDGDSAEDAEARALLNKFLGASVLMAGMRSYVVDKPAPAGKLTLNKESVRSSGGEVHTERSAQHLDLEQCWDERLLKKLLEESTDYEQRRLVRARIRTLMAEQEACAAAVSEAASCAEEQQEQRIGDSPTAESGDADVREEEVTVTSSVRRNSTEKTVSSTSTTTRTSKVIESVRTAPKPVSPFAKFRQLEKQNSASTPNSPSSPQPASPGSRAPLFRFTDPALQASAATIKERLLQWCRDKTRDYENVKLENFSSSWADGLAFCALVHHFVPDAFDYSKLTPDKRRHNFTLAFKVADEKAGIYPLLDVEDMVETRRPDWKCVFTYVQAIHRRFRDQP